MRKLLMAIALLSISLSNLHAAASTTKPGRGAAASSSMSENFGWTVGLGGLVALGVMVGVIASAASDSSSSFSH